MLGTLRLISAIVFFALCAACSDTSDRTERDAGQPDASTPDAGTSFADSQQAWASLVEENGETYWYRVSSCGQGYRQVTSVQVTQNEVTAVERNTEENADCARGEPYTYESFVGRTLDALYEECERRVQRVGLEESNFAVDDEGVISSCWQTAPQCADACDEGFYITDRGFGAGDHDDDAGMD